MVILMCAALSMSPAARSFELLQATVLCTVICCYVKHLQVESWWFTWAIQKCPEAKDI